MDVEARLQRFNAIRHKGSLNAETRDAGFVARPGSAVLVKRLPLTPHVIDYKVGLYHSRGRLGRAVQGAGTALVPSNSSKLRSPVRSTISSALTPGGGGVGRPIGRVEKFRCPAGFEHGGRFTGRNLDGCGRHLFVPARGFDLPRLGGVGRQGRGDVGPGTPLGFDPRIPNAGEASARLIRGSRFPGSGVIARNVNIPHPGGLNINKRNASISKAASLVRDNDRRILVRQDGIALEPNTTLASLAGLRDNNDMAGATIVVSGRNRALGKAEVPTLFSSPISRVTFALPGDQTASLIKSRAIAARERQALQAQWASNGGADGLQALAAASKGALRFEYSGSAAEYEDIRVKPSGGGASRMVPKWVYETFLKKGAPAKGSETWIKVTE